MVRWPAYVMVVLIVLGLLSATAGAAPADDAILAEKSAELGRAVEELERLESSGAAPADVREARDEVARLRQLQRDAQRAADAVGDARNLAEDGLSSADDLGGAWDAAVEDARRGDFSDLLPSRRTLALLLGLGWIYWRLRAVRRRRVQL